MTSFEFSVHAMPEVTLFTLRYPWQAAAGALEAWQSWIAAAPDELWSNFLLLLRRNRRVPLPDGRSVLRARTIRAHVTARPPEGGQSD